jgi:hypothetical protein
MAPRLIALLACQEILPEAGDAITLSRVVSSLSMSCFPSTVRGCLFIRVANLSGDHLVQLEFRDSRRGVIIDSAEWDVQAAGDRAVHDFTVDLDVDIPEPATIHARILVDGHVIGWTDFDIHLEPETR